jgi:hypothetical protein
MLIMMTGAVGGAMKALVDVENQTAIECILVDTALVLPSFERAAAS